MRTAEQAYVLSAAIAIVAMAGRPGWIDWGLVGHVVGHVAAATLAGADTLLTLVVLTTPSIGVFRAVAAVARMLPAPGPAGPAEEPPPISLLHARNDLDQLP